MDMYCNYRTKTAEETFGVGKELAVYLLKQSQSSTRAVVVFLYGELGSGKTTLAGGIAYGLGHRGRLQSPTYTIIKEYELPAGLRLFHIDLYRVDASDADELGLCELASHGSNIILIEWPERLRQLIPYTLSVHCQAYEGYHTVRVARELSVP